MTEDWSRYYDATGDEPRETLLDAVGRFGGETGLAIDLGCGTGRDTAALLARGWRVLAIDGSAEGIRRLTARPDVRGGRLETRVVAMEDADLPAALLVNASFALPFCPPDRFHGLWERIGAALPAGGRFCGQLFGERDQWAGNGLAIHTRAEVERLFAQFVLERFWEIDEDSETAFGDLKHWHLFHVVARKR